MNRYQSLLAVSLLLGACSSTVPAEYDPTMAGPEIESAIMQAKADGAFGARDISLGATVSGTTSGDGLVLYTFQGTEGDRIRIDVTQTSGDLRPSAYLYEGVDTLVGPDDYEAGATQVVLNYTLGADGAHYIAVRAYRGEGAGGFSATLTCTGGPCAAGSSLMDLARADQCLTRAADCALRELPSFNGRVGAATAETLLQDCLAEEGTDCVDACDAHEHLAHTCQVIAGELPFLADQSRGCLVRASYCLDICNEVAPYAYGEEDYLISATCWDGHQGDSSSADGDCVEYYSGLNDCGGGEYEGDTQFGCERLCEATDGAWDEGPFDGCYDECLQ